MSGESEVREANERGALLRDVAGVGAFELKAVDPDDPFAPGAPAFYYPEVPEMLGRAEDQFPPVVGSWISALHPDDRARVQGFRREHAEATGELLHIEYRVVTRTGEVRWWHERSRTLPGKTPGRVRIAAGVRDITDEKRNTDLQRRHAELLRQTQAAAHVGGWELDLITSELHWTEETRRIHEIPDDFVPTLEQGINFYAPEHVPLITAAVNRCMQGETYSVELDLITFLGKRVHVHATGHPYIENGKVTRLYGAFRDVSVEKRREDELRAQLDLIARQESAIRALSTPIIQLWDNIITLPVIGTLDAARATQIMDRLLSEVVRLRARFAILDLTGVDAIDTTTADQLFRIIHAVKLLGARALLCGLMPGVAQSLTELGVDISPFLTHRNLQEALQSCIRELGRRGG